MKRDSTVTIILCGIILGIITFSSNAKAGALNGLMLCESVIIPALLPMLILTNIIIKSRSARIIELLFGWATERILRLPRCATGAILFGLIGGYPAGCVLTNGLYDAGLIDERDARRIMSFNLTGGMAFIITAVGTIKLKSTRLGVVLFLSSILSSLMLALAYSIGKDKPERAYNSRSYLSFADAMVESVDATTHSILNMCAYIILFSAISSIVPIPAMISPLIEITNGIMPNEGGISLPMYAFYLSFGGVCIHFQLIGMLRNMGISYPYFLLNRLASGIISYAIMTAYLHLFPRSDEVFSNIAQKTPALSQVNTGLSIVMLIGCVVIIFDIESKKYKLI